MLRKLALAALLWFGPVPAFADAVMWQGSRIPYFDLDGGPAVGWTVEFFNCETSTPQVVYEDAALGTPMDQPAESDARGMFDAIFLSPDPGCVRVRVEDQDGATIFDDDGVAVPQASTFEDPDAGETSEELLFRVGMMQPYYGTSAPTGWVRAAGRTIGSAASGATERANDDCEDLFIHLWTVDSTLTVSTGRGGSAASDWAANKTIALPDLRDRSIGGLATMGNSDAGLVSDSYVDGGENTSTLGATAGVDDLTLSEAQLAAHDHDATFTGSALAGHTHTLTSDDSAHGLNGENNNGNFYTSDGDVKTDEGPEVQATSSDSAGTPAGTVDTLDAGSGAAINNMPPMAYMTILIKL